jgi:hypothetical protein
MKTQDELYDFLQPNDAYLDWIAALEMENYTDSVIQVAREGLSRIPRDYTVRAEVAS